MGIVKEIMQWEITINSINLFQIREIASDAWEIQSRIRILDKFHHLNIEMMILLSGMMRGQTAFYAHVADNTETAKILRQLTNNGRFNNMFSGRGI